MTSPAMVCRKAIGRDAEAQFLESLNICFPGWGGRKEFEWCFAREGAERRPDLMTLHADGHLIAGSANTYRRVRLSTGRTIVAAIMTGSWTLPEARRLGAFTRIIRESRELAAARGAGLLLGFGARHNASAGRLREAGSALFPSFYCRSTAKHAATRATCSVRSIGEIAEKDLDALRAAHALEGSHVDHGTRIVYTSSEWRDQFAARPLEVLHVQGDGGKPWEALIERAPDFDRLLTLSAEADDAVWLDAIDVLECQAAAANRRLFLFTMSRERAIELAARDFEIVDGWLYVLVADEHLLRSGLDLKSASRPSPDWPLASQALADPASPWRLDGWSAEHGDRM